MNYRKCLLAALLIPAAVLSQNYEVPVSEAQEPMMKGKYDEIGRASCRERV